jgi:hypothetical protein
MKRFLLLIAVVAVSLFVLAGCEMLEGNPGDTYMAVTCDGVADGLLYRLPDFNGYTDGYYYAINEGTFSGDYVLWYYYGWSDYEEEYIWYFNVDFALMNPSEVSDSEATDYFASNYYTLEGYHNDITYTITANPGSLFFQNGEDIYYELNLDWDPASSAILSNKVPMKEVVIENSADKVIKEFSDKKNTIRVEIKKNTAPAGSRVTRMK